MYPCSSTRVCLLVGQSIYYDSENISMSCIIMNSFNQTGGPIVGLTSLVSRKLKKKAFKVTTIVIPDFWLISIRSADRWSPLLSVIIIKTTPKYAVLRCFLVTGTLYLLPKPYGKNTVDKLGSVRAVSGHTVNPLYLCRRGFGSKYKVPVARKHLRIA